MRKMGYLKRLVVLFTLVVFVLSSYTISTAAPKVESYCSRTSEPVLAVNIGGQEDVTVEGVNYKRQDSVSNFYVSVREPESDQSPNGVSNAFSRIEAERFLINSGVTQEGCSDVDGGQNIAYIGNGDYTGYDNIYFPRGVKGFHARVASELQEGGYIEIRLDQPGGELIGKCRVTGTGGWQKYADVFCQLSRNIEGLHKIYLYYRGEKDNGLFNVNWFKFTKDAFTPVKAREYSEFRDNYYAYNQMDFGEMNGPIGFKARVFNKVNGTLDLKIDSVSGMSIGTVNVSSSDTNPGYIEGIINQRVTGVHNLYLVDNVGTNLIAKIDWFVFEPGNTQLPMMEGNLSRLLSTQVKGYQMDITTTLERNNVYEVYFYTTDLSNESRQVYDVLVNGTEVDTVDTERSGQRWEKKGPYLAKVLNDGQLTLRLVSKRGQPSIAGIQYNKVTYTKSFKDVNIKDWHYIPVMELASKGVISGKGNNMFKPSEHIIGEHVAYMMFNVMKRALAEKDPAFIPGDYEKMQDVSPEFWAYQYMNSYYNYFFKEKMLKYDINTKTALSAKAYENSKKARREEFAMAMIGAKRLDYNEDGKVFALDPDREPGSKLNNYRDKDAAKITDSYKYFIELALEKGIMKGDNRGYLNPKGPVTRGEAAAFIYNALNLKENNFVKPLDAKTIPVPRITAKKRNVKVGIMVLPSLVNNSADSDPNPDFSLLELLDRNINKPMDWVLTNPFPPKFDKNEFRDVLNFNSAKTPGVNVQNFDDFFKHFKDLKSIAKAQTDLEADITNSGAVANPDNKKKSKFFKYWEVALDDPGLTPEKIAKNYDILFQTSHGKITYSPDVQAKMKAFLNAGGQLWWENCKGLEIDPGTGFTDDIKFVSLNTGNNYKYPQTPVLNAEGNIHPLLDNIYRIDPNKTTRVGAPGLFNKNNEISMLGDGEEWLNDDNRYMSGELPTDTIVLNVEEPNGTKHPNIIVRDVKNATDTAGRIIMTTTDIGCGISKHTTRSGGKAVEDFKFCYNLFGWMSRIGVSFDETNDEAWNGKDNVTLKATVTNNGAKPQTYDLVNVYKADTWDLAVTHEYDNYKTRYPWILSLDTKGYPNKVKLGANQSERITYKLSVKSAQSLRYDFTLKANESGAIYTRDIDEDTYTLYKEKLNGPEFAFHRAGANSASKDCLDVVIGTPDKSQLQGMAVTYVLTLKFKDNIDFMDPSMLVDNIEEDRGGNVALYDSMAYAYESDGTGTTVVKVKIDNARFTSKDQKIKLKVWLERPATYAGYEADGRIETFDPNTRQRIAYSNETTLNLR